MNASQLLVRGGLLMLGVWASSGNCSAQVRRYRPNSPTVSPYLNLTRFNNGAVPNYYSLVRPQLYQRAINRQEQAVRRKQAGALARLRNDVQRGLQPASPTGTGSRFLTPGSRSTHLNTSRYYPQTQLGGRRR